MKMNYGCLIAGLGCALTALPSSATTAPSPEDLLKELKRQQQQLELQRQELVKQREAFEKQQQQMQTLAEQVRAFSSSSPIPRHDLSSLRGGGLVDYQRNTPATSQESATSQKEAAGSDNKPASGVVGIDRKPQEAERPPEVAANIEEGGVLLPKGTFVLTPGLSYTNSSASRVAIEGFSIIPALNIGLFEITELSRNTFNAFVQARYGVTNRFEIEAKVPYLYREDNTTNRPIGVGSSSEVLTRIDGSGIGDIELGAHYQLNRGRDNWPFFIGNLRFKTRTGTSPFDVPTDPATGLQTELPTGSGFYAVQPSLTMIYPLDPVVFYSNMGYIYNHPHDYGGSIGEINPGDTISTGLGFSLAFNERSSFSLGYSHSTVLRTQVDGLRLPNTTSLQVGTLDMGYAYQINDKMSVNFNLSAGVTEDAPDVSTTFRLPIKFDFLD